MKRVLLTGISGTGKSTMIKSLSALGYRAVDLDQDGYSELVDVPGDDPGTLEPGRDWLWNEERVGSLLTEEGGDVLFVSGCAPNQRIFASRFDAVILLTAPAAVIERRLATRTTNSYGKGPGETARVIGQIETIEPLLRRGATAEIDTDQPLEAVITAVLRIAEAR